MLQFCTSFLRLLHIELRTSFALIITALNKAKQREEDSLKKRKEFLLLIMNGPSLESKNG